MRMNSLVILSKRVLRVFTSKTKSPQRRSADTWVERFLSRLLKLYVTSMLLVSLVMWLALTPWLLQGLTQSLLN